MLDQSITERNLKLLGTSTWKKFKPGVEYDQFIFNSYKKIEIANTKNGYTFSPFKKHIYKGKVGFDFSTAEDELVLKKLNDSVRRLFKVNPSDRHAIIKQTIALSEDAQPITIARLDIESFYEKIDRNHIVEYVIREWLLSHQNRLILRNWDNQLTKQGISGLPRGMSLSATLSEIRIRQFDREVRKNEKVYYYARYVDDIIVFYTGNKSALVHLLDETLKDTASELSFNSSKSSYTSLDDNERKKLEIDYLGYKIELSKKSHDSSKGIQKRNVEVFISDKKIIKIKKRVRTAFSAYIRDRRFNLLLSRLKFLSGNQYIIGDIDRTKLKSGIYYNYPLITNLSQLDELDKFYKKLIKTKKQPVSNALTMIRNFQGNPDNVRFKKIDSISFKFGYTNRLMNSFSSDFSKKIRKCW